MAALRRIANYRCETGCSRQAAARVGEVAPLAFPRRLTPDGTLAPPPTHPPTHPRAGPKVKLEEIGEKLDSIACDTTTRVRHHNPTPQPPKLANSKQVKLEEIGEKLAPSIACDTIEGAIEAARNLKYPVICRAAFALGGLGSGFADNDEQLTKIVAVALSSSPQVRDIGACLNPKPSTLKP